MNRNGILHLESSSIHTSKIDNGSTNWEGKNSQKIEEKEKKEIREGNERKRRREERRKVMDWESRKEERNERTR